MLPFLLNGPQPGFELQPGIGQLVLEGRGYRDAVENGINRIIHLAALQVPFCKANPVTGARVNVVGTVKVWCDDRDDRPTATAQGTYVLPL